MGIYSIKTEIAELMEKLVDEETGEVNEEVYAQLEQLEQDKTAIIQWMVKQYFNEKVQQAGIKAEIDRLNGMMEVRKKNEEHWKKLIDRECAGEKTDLGIAIVSYRKSKTVQIDDEDAFIERHRGTEFVKETTQFKPNKILIKDALKYGAVDGASIVENVSMSIK